MLEQNKPVIFTKGNKTLMGRNHHLNIAVQEDLRDKISEVVHRLTKDAQKGDFNRRLNAHALFFQDVALVDDGPPHFICARGSILREKECGEYFLNVGC